MPPFISKKELFQIGILDNLGDSGKEAALDYESRCGVASRTIEHDTLLNLIRQFF